MKTSFTPPYMSKTMRRPQAGFTLIELLTVIAIIGILASIIIPTLGAVLENVRRSTEAANLRSIGQGAATYAAANDGAFPDPLGRAGQKLSGDNLRKWMALLSKSGAMQDPKLYFSKVDKNFPAPVDLPASVLKQDKSGADPKFQDLTPAFEVVGGLRQGDPATTPIGFTRGLKTNGEWDAKKGVYADWGGHVVFLNGSINTFQGSVNGKLSSTKEVPTDNINDTIPTPKGGNQRIYGMNGVIGTVEGVAPKPTSR